MANNVDRLSRNIHRIVERADIQIPPAPRFPTEAVTGPTTSRLAAVARFNGDLQKWRNDRWSVDAPFVTEAELSRSVTKLSDEQALLTTRFEVGLLDLAELEARVTVLETSVTNIDARVTVLESAVGAAVPHTILDAAVHTDSVTQTVTRGALIYGNVTPKWDLLTIGSGATYLRSDGIDVAWSSVVATEITGTLGVDHGGTGVTTLTGIIQGNGVSPMTGITGTANYVPKWSATAPYLTATSLIYDSGTGIGIGTTTPQTALTFPVSSTGITLYNTADMLTDYEVGWVKWVGNRFEIGTARGGTGTQRIVNFTSPIGQFNFGRATGGTSGLWETNVQTMSSNVNLIRFGPNTTVTAAGKGAVFDTDGVYGPSSGSNAEYSWFGVFPTISTSGTVSNMRFSMFRISPRLSSVTGITSSYLIDAGTNTGSANTGTHTPMFLVDTTGNTRFAGGIVVGSVLTAAVGGTYYAFINDGATSGSSTMVTLNHGSSSVPAVGFGTDILYKLESDSTADQDAGALRVAWTTETNANRTAAMYFRLVNNAAAISTQMVLSATGGLSVGSGTLDTLPVGVINAVTGFRANNAATSGEFLRGNGTNFVSSAILLADLPAGSAVTFANPTAFVSTAAVNGVAVTAMRSDGAPAIDQAMGPTWTGGHTWDLGTAAPADDPLSAISLSATALVAAGFRDSHAFALIGQSFDASPHSLGWRQWVNVTSNAGASSWVLQRNIDLGTYVTKLRVYDTGLVEVGPDGVGVTQLDTYGLGIVNTTPAVAGAANQQWSGPLRWEGQGWQTGTSTSMKTEFRQYVASVQGSAAPTAYWVLEHSINDVAYTELMRADSTGYVRITKNALASIDTTLGQSAFGLQINNDTAATAVVTTQDAPPVIFKLAAWNSSALTSQDWRWRMLAKGVTVAGTTTSYLRIDSGISGSNFGNPLVLYSSGGASLGSVLAEQPLGVLSVQVGFRIAGGAASGQFLRGNGTNFISAAIGPGDIPLAAVTAHALLSTTHSDTVAAVVARGALIVGKNASPTWERLVMGTAGQVLTVVGSDVAWATPAAGTSFDNPTASVGLTAVNGVATTAMRSDAAPPLSVAIIPTWTGRHIWSYTALGVTPDDAKGISVVNSTAAALGAQQLSSSFSWEGNGWGTTAGTSQAVRARSYILPVQGATPTGILKFEHSIAGGGYADSLWLSLRTGGMVALGGSNYGLRHYAGTSNPDSTDSEFAELFRVTGGGGRIGLRSTGTGSYGDLQFLNGGATWMTFSPTGSFRVGDNTAPTNTSWLEVAAGTTTIAPINFISGLLLTTPQAGALEYNGQFFLTATDAVRRAVVAAVNSTKTTAGAPFVNDGYVTVEIAGTTLRLMTTA